MLLFLILYTARIHSQAGYHKSGNYLFILSCWRSKLALQFELFASLLLPGKSFPALPSFAEIN